MSLMSDTRYAWTNVRETRERREVEAAKAEAAQAARNAHLASLASGATYHHDATRRYHTTMMSSVRDEPAPSPPPGLDRGTPTPAPTGDDEKSEAGADSPPAELVQKLMDAALVRELQPVHIGTDERQYHFAPPAEPTPDPDPHVPPVPLPPVRLSEQIAQGHVPLNFAFNVATSQMGGVDDMDEA